MDIATYDNYHQSTLDQKIGLLKTVLVSKGIYTLERYKYNL